MCNSNAPTSMIEQGIVVRCHSGSFISIGLEKKRQIMPDLEILQPALKPSVCEKEYLVRLAIPQDGRKKIWQGKHAKGQVVWKKTHFQVPVLWIVLLRLACVGFHWFQSTVGFNLRFVSPRGCFDSLPCPGCFRLGHGENRKKRVESKRRAGLYSCFSLEEVILSLPWNENRTVEHC